jgi:hypothetical protein
MCAERDLGLGWGTSSVVTSPSGIHDVLERSHLSDYFSSKSCVAALSP